MATAPGKDEGCSPCPCPAGTPGAKSAEAPAGPAGGGWSRCPSGTPAGRVRCGAPAAIRAKSNCLTRSIQARSWMVGTSGPPRERILATMSAAEDADDEDEVEGTGRSESASPRWEVRFQLRLRL